MIIQSLVFKVNRLRKTSSAKTLVSMKEKQRLQKKRLSLAFRNKENMREKKRKAKVQDGNRILKTSADRISDFKKAVRYGPIFPCCCCEQLMFQNGVVKFEKSLLDLIQSKCAMKENSLFTDVFGDKLVDKSYRVSIEAKSESSAFLCHTCKKHLMKGKMPPMQGSARPDFDGRDRDRD